ncbi:MAG: hypothetical protein ACUVQO_17275, partial [Leptodesmis sp.]
TLVIFHHDPLHDDAYLDEIGTQVKRAFPGGLMAREGLSIPLYSPPLTSRFMQKAKVSVQPTAWETSMSKCKACE